MFFLSGITGYEFYVSILLTTLFIAYKAFQKYGICFALVFIWVSFSALRIFAAPESPYDAAEEPIWVACLSLAAASTLVFIYFTLSVAQWFAMKNTSFLVQILALLNASAILGGAFLDQPCGLLLNASMSGCFNACVFPLFFTDEGRAPPLALIFIPLSILVTAQSQPLALLFLPIGVVLLYKRKFIALFLSIFAALGAGMILCGRDLFDSTGRVAVWSEAFYFWQAHANPWLGFGLGSFYFIGPKLTIPKWHMGFIWLHSDWLQIGFECGIIGLALALLFYGAALYRVRKDLRHFTSLCVFGAWMLANFPLHNPLSGFLGACLIVSAFLKRAPQSLESFDTPL